MVVKDKIMKIFLLFFLLLVMGCTSAPLNKDKFEDYVPWWSTNKADVTTNTIYKAWSMLCLF